MPNASSPTLETDIAHLRSGLKRLSDDAQSVAERHKSATRLQNFVQRLSEASRSLGGEEKPVDESQVDWLNFGAVLRRHRKAALLGQKELGALIDVSASYIRAFENGTRRPGIKVLMRLLTLGSLRMSLDDLAPRTAGVYPALWLAPKYDPREMLADLCGKLAGSGCSLEQTYSYLDTQSASDFLSLTNQSDYQVGEWDRSKPIEQFAKQIAASVTTEWLDVVALGCGDAKKECALVNSLMRHSEGRFKIRLLLLDISHALLTEGYKRACAVLRDVTIVALQGSFHELAQYPIFFEQRNRVLTMLGNTLANLDTELRFFRDTLAGASLGDFFILDFTQALGDPERPEEILASDSALNGVRDMHERWITGIFQRYCREMRGIEINIELNTDCVVRGSYELSYVARVDVGETSPPKRFVVFRIRRYDGALLERSLARTGWAQVKRLNFGANGSNKLQLMLLRKEPARDVRRSTLPEAEAQAARH